MTNIMTYTDYVQHRLLRVAYAQCGDTLEIRWSGLHFEPRLIERALHIFVECYGVVPEVIALHPRARATMTAPAIDVYLVRDKTESADLVRHADPDTCLMGIRLNGPDDCVIVNAEGMPIAVPFVSEDSLGEGTVAVRYHVALCTQCQLVEQYRVAVASGDDVEIARLALALSGVEVVFQETED